jgi:hypothetical protein
MPIVLPSIEKLWQLAQVGIPVSIARLSVLEMSRKRQVINGSEL